MTAAYSHIQGLTCVTCGRTYPLAPPRLICTDCGPLAGTLDVDYDRAALAETFGPSKLAHKTDPTIWRYHELLPVTDPGTRVPIPVGMTPLYELPTNPPLVAGPKRLLVKDDTRLPTGSSKDRATAVAVARARMRRTRAIAAASTGNAASSLAAFAARAGLPCYIFTPATAPPAKLAQIRAHGATLLAVEGTYDEAYDLCMAVCDEHGFYNRNTAVNPFLCEGKKTIALEIWEQLGYRIPDTIVLPVGDGCILSGVFKGFRDLLDLRLIPRLPRLVGVQAAGSAALATAWEEGRDRCEVGEATTVADSIAVAKPRDQVKALRAVRESGGCFITVGDEAILDAVGLLARRAGILVEPAAAAPLAGLKLAAATRSANPGEEVVLLLTGHGLKDLAALTRAAARNEPFVIRPQLADVERVLEGKRRDG